MNRAGLLRVEATATRAWPAAEEEQIGNWLLRFNHGYTKRANSAYVVGPVNADDVSEIRSWYTARDQPFYIREVSLWANPDLEHELIRQNFRRFDETLIMTGNLAEADVAIELLDPAEWITWYATFEGATKGNQVHHLALINRINTPVALAIIRSGGQPVACGLAVADADWVGLFDIATDPTQRRRGHGRQLMQGLMEWGMAQGARSGYLQVLATNVPAIELYERLGFGERYRNWYWTET
jgi:ribosomal protein S18 acetylase RimI-like enzyme